MDKPMNTLQKLQTLPLRAENFKISTLRRFFKVTFFWWPFDFAYFYSAKSQWVLSLERVTFI